MNEKEIAGFIDHTLLKPEATIENIEVLCGQAVLYGFKTVCVNSGWVSTASDFLVGSGVAVTSVIGFPFGANAEIAKIYEVTDAIANGADELDFVINIGLLKSGEYGRVLEELTHLISRAVPATMSENDKIITKVIIETGLLTDDEKMTATKISVDAGADFVKTCTGFSIGEATVDDINLILASGAPQVKASGGVNTLEKFTNMINAGATRIGTSSGIRIIKESLGEEFTAQNSY
jgi:deoxyribose-phosphate aldolase